MNLPKCPLTTRQRCVVRHAPSGFRRGFCPSSPYCPQETSRLYLWNLTVLVVFFMNKSYHTKRSQGLNKMAIGTLENGGQTPRYYQWDQKFDKTKAPVVQAYELPDGHWGVWCGYCDRWHYHGPAPGHRCAPCDAAGGFSTSPYYETGYILEAAGRAPAHLIAAGKRKRRSRHPL